METKFVTESGYVLEKDEEYQWSGSTHGLYKSCSWKIVRCKIVDIDKDSVTIYDFDDNKEYKYDKDQLNDNRSLKFKPKKIL